MSVGERKEKMTTVCRETQASREQKTSETSPQMPLRSELVRGGEIPTNERNAKRLNLKRRMQKNHMESGSATGTGHQAQRRVDQGGKKRGNQRGSDSLTYHTTKKREA